MSEKYICVYVCRERESREKAEKVRRTDRQRYRVKARKTYWDGLFFAKFQKNQTLTFR